MDRLLARWIDLGKLKIMETRVGAVARILGNIPLGVGLRG